MIKNFSCVIAATLAVAMATPALAQADTTAGNETQNTAANRNESGGLRALVSRHASAHGVPAPVAHAVVMLESRYRPQVVHKGNFGLMQIRFGTARAMGYRGSPSGLLNAETNLQYGMKYLARGWKASGGDLCRTIAHYQTGRVVRSVPASSQAYCTRARRIMAQR